MNVGTDQAKNAKPSFLVHIVGCSIAFGVASRPLRARTCDIRADWRRALHTPPLGQSGCNPVAKLHGENGRIYSRLGDIHFHHPTGA